MSLTLSQYADAKKLDPKLLEAAIVRDGEYNGQPAVEFNYYDEKREHLFARHRLYLKAPDKQPKIMQPSGISLMPYGLWNLKDYSPDYLVVVEGEVDAQTMWQHNIQAIGIPGDQWKDAWNKYLEKFEEVYFVIETEKDGTPDGGGKALLGKIPKTPFSEKVGFLFLPGYGDTNEMHVADPDKFMENWELAMSKVQHVLPIPEPRFSHEVTDKEFPPQPWVIENVFADPGMMMIAGKEGSMKSFMALEIAIAAAQGGDLWGTFPVPQRNVLIIDFENTDQIFHDRMHALFYPEKPPQLPIQYHNEDTMGEISYKNVQMLRKMCKKYDISMVIFDSFTRFLEDKSENDSQDTREVFREFRKMTREGISLVFLHHNRKPMAGSFAKSASSADIRGSGDLPAAMNSVWGVEMDEKKKKLNIYQHKLREAEKKYAGFVLGIDADRNVGSLKYHFEGELDVLNNKKDQVTDEVVALLRNNDGYLSIPEIKGVLQAEGVGGGDNMLRKILKELGEKKLVKEAKGSELGKTGRSEAQRKYYSWDDTEAA